MPCLLSLTPCSLLPSNLAFVPTCLLIRRMNMARGQKPASVATRRWSSDRARDLPSCCCCRRRCRRRCRHCCPCDGPCSAPCLLPPRRSTAPTKGYSQVAALQGKQTAGESPSQALERALSPLYGISSNPRSVALKAKYASAAKPRVVQKKAPVRKPVAKAAPAKKAPPPKKTIAKKPVAKKPCVSRTRSLGHLWLCG